MAETKITPQELALGMPIQMVRSEYSAVDTTATAIPYDDTIPQISEGKEFMTVSITPKNTTNILKVEVDLWSNTSANANCVGALFQDATANAFAAKNTYHPITQGISYKLVGYIAAGTVSSTTLRFRMGTSAGTLTINGETATRFLGAITKSSINVAEYKA